MRELPLVRDHMDKHVYTVTPETDVLDAVALLLRHRVTGAPVVDTQDRLVGMLTERDCMRLVVKGDEGDLPRGKVKDYMATSVTTISPEVDIYYAAGLLLNETFRRLPVVEDGKLVGAITRFDLLRVIRSFLHPES